MRKILVVLVGTAAMVIGLSSCGNSAEQSGRQGTGQPAPAPAATQQVGSPEQELAGIGSTLDAIDGELAADGSP
jgi:hypothetical protein